MDIFNAWTIPEEIEKWFLKSAYFIRSENELNKLDRVQAGDSYKWIWHLYEETESGTIMEVKENEAIMFTFAGQCIVEIRLSDDGDYTIVELTHKNIPTDDNSKQYIRIGCASGWSFYMVNLKSVYEGGIDLRNKDERLTPMVNN